MKAQSVKWIPLSICLLLSACASQPQTQVNYVKATERFTGTLPCNDCSGVDTDLILKRDAITGSPDGFYLHEVKIDAPGGERVRTSWGNWSKNQSVMDFKRQIYVLQPEVGNNRAYRLTDAGDLKPLNERGTTTFDDDGNSVALQLQTPNLAPPSETTTPTE